MTFGFKVHNHFFSFDLSYVHTPFEEPHPGCGIKDGPICIVSRDRMSRKATRAGPFLYIICMCYTGACMNVPVACVNFINAWCIRISPANFNDHKSAVKSFIP